MRYLALCLLVFIFTVPVFPAMASQSVVVDKLDKLIDNPIFTVGLGMNLSYFIVGCLNNSRLMVVVASLGFCGIIAMFLLA
jgi:hypothetical protein